MKMPALILCTVLLAFSNSESKGIEARFFVSEPAYVLGGFTDNEHVPGSLKLTQSNQIKISLNVNYRIMSFTKDYTGFYLGYTQKSFWNFFDYSAPFFDNNYQPEIYFFISNNDLVRGLEQARWIPSLKLALNHHSNGMVDLRDRTWDRAILTAEFGGSKTTFAVSAWIPLQSGKMNSDIAEYAGIGSIKIMHSEVNDDVLHWAASLNSHYRLHNASITSLELSFFYNPFHNASGALNQLPPLMLQAYWGRAETLMSYKRLTRALRIGLAFM